MKVPKKKVPRRVKTTVWRTHIGEVTEGKCYCCGTKTIHITDFEVGYNIAESKGGTNDISNLRPICGDCNRSMGTESIEEFKAKWFSKGAKIAKKPRASKKAISKKDKIPPVTITEVCEFARNVMGLSSAESARFGSAWMSKFSNYDFNELKELTKFARARLGLSPGDAMTFAFKELIRKQK